MKLSYLFNVVLISLVFVPSNAQNKATAHKRTIKTTASGSLLDNGDRLMTAYKWNDAVNAYKKYISQLVREKTPTETTQSKLEQAQMGAKMINGVERVVIIDSLVVEKDSFLTKYQLSTDAGLLTTYEQYFKSNDKNYGTVYINELENRMIYSNNGKLYNCTKLINKWSTPQILPAPLNIDGQNYNYPFLQTDGTTLSYASTAESLGKLDIFITSNDSADTYLKPQNIGMPFNSPDNDYMYTIDETNNLGWFASDRRQPENKVCIYVFVPNKTKKVYDQSTMDAKQLIHLAEIHAIRETWVDNDSIVQAALQRLSEIKKANDVSIKRTKKEHLFIVNDKISYSEASDFKSPEAKKLYIHYEQLYNQQKQQEAKLEEMRNTYTNTEAGKREAMIPGLMDLEKHVSLLKRQAKDTEKFARNTENIYLKNN